MRLRALLAAEQLGLTVLVGEDQLDRNFERVFTATLRDPRRYLTGGELVLSGMEWWPTPADSDAFIAALTQAGVSALGAGTAGAGGGAIPEHVITACRRYGLPLLEVPVSVSFATISERAILWLAAERAEWPAEAGAPLDRYRRLVATSARSGGVEELTRTGAMELGAQCWVLSATGRVLAGQAPPPGLATHFLRATRLPTAVQTENGPVTLLAAATRDRHRLAGWCLAVAGDHENWNTEYRGLASELATLLGLEHARRAEATRITARAALPLLQALSTETTDIADVRARLPAADIDDTEPVYVVTVAAPDGPPGIAAALLTELLAPLSDRAIVSEMDGEAFALAPIPSHSTPGTTDDVVATLKAAAHTLEPALIRMRLAIGVSHACGAAGLRAAVVEARRLRGFAESVPAPVTLIDRGDVASHLIVLAAMPDTLRQSFRASVLGPVLDYDAQHNSDLIHSLRIFLQHSGSWIQASAALHVHVNTLRYRINRIAELTGRDLTSFPDRVDLYLALGP